MDRLEALEQKWRDAWPEVGPSAGERLFIEDSINGWIALDLPSDHPSPAVVTDEMVERALDEYVTPSETLPHRAILRDRMRAALTAALTPQEPGHE